MATAARRSFKRYWTENRVNENDKSELANTICVPTCITRQRASRDVNCGESERRDVTVRPRLRDCRRQPIARAHLASVTHTTSLSETGLRQCTHTPPLNGDPRDVRCCNVLFTPNRYGVRNRIERHGLAARRLSVWIFRGKTAEFEVNFAWAMERG